MTSHNVLEKDLRGTRSIGDEHVASNKAVRRSADAAARHQAGGTAARCGRESRVDAREVERRLKSEAKQVKQGAKRLRPKK